MLGIGLPELLVIALLLLLFGGTKRLPELSRGVGESLRDLRHGFKKGREEITNIKEEFSNGH